MPEHVRQAHDLLSDCPLQTSSVHGNYISIQSLLLGALTRCAGVLSIAANKASVWSLLLSGTAGTACCCCWAGGLTAGACLVLAVGAPAVRAPRRGSSMRRVHCWSVSRWLSAPLSMTACSVSCASHEHLLNLQSHLAWHAL
jgi:hypothetical protein